MGQGSGILKRKDSGHMSRYEKANILHLRDFRELIISIFFLSHYKYDINEHPQPQDR